MAAAPSLIWVAMSDIYLVDDHALLREGLRALLETRGHRIIGESSDLTEALAQIRSLVPAVLLLDLHLGERSGLELLADLQRRGVSTRTIVLTMSAQPRDVAEALRLGAAGYVLKGAAGAELLAAIDAVLEGQRHLGSQVAELAVRGLTTDGDDQSKLASLSARERQIATQVVRGKSSAEIGALLHLSPKTVDSYRSRLMGKLGVADVPALVRLAIRTGLIAADEP
jgi:two-component system, NarL family, invasion response regulator UvrY